MARKIRIYPDGRSPKRVNFTCGVYEIVHVPSKRRYVGSSVEVEKRLYLHLKMLQIGRHHCNYLQNVWNKYGEEDFKFYLLERCTREDIVKREQFHIDKTPSKLRMNSLLFAHSALGQVMSKESRKKMSVAAKIVANTPEQKRMRSERAKRQHENGTLGKPIQEVLTKRTCKKCGDIYQHERLPDGKLSQSKYCPQCRPKTHSGGNYKHRDRGVCVCNRCGIVLPKDRMSGYCADCKLKARREVCNRWTAKQKKKKK